MAEATRYYLLPGDRVLPANDPEQWLGRITQQDGYVSSRYVPHEGHDTATAHEGIIDESDVRDFEADVNYFEPDEPEHRHGHCPNMVLPHKSLNLQIYAQGRLLRHLSLADP